MAKINSKIWMEIHLLISKWIENLVNPKNLELNLKILKNNDQILSCPLHLLSYHISSILMRKKGTIYIFL